METMTQMQIPYIGTVSRSFTPGNGLKIYGVVPVAALRFSVSLQCSAEIEAQSDVALQITINIQEGYVRVNSMRRGIWDELHHIQSPLVKCDERFVLGIICDFTQYKISVNNRYICEFPQRISYDRVTHLVIDGNVALDRISYEMEPSAPSYYMDPLTIAPGIKHTDEPPPYSEVQSRGVNYGACPLPTSSLGMPPYPAGSTFTPAIPGRKPHPIEEIYPSHDTMIPLNAASSNFRPVQPRDPKKYIAYGCCIFFAVVIILAGLLTKTSRNHRHHHYRVDHGDDRDY